MENLIKKGVEVKPTAFIVYGPAGIGKTTLLTKMPKAIIITGEEIEEADTHKFPKCETWDDLLRYLTWVRDADHDYQSLGIDTLDAIQGLAEQHILKENRAKDMATACGGYGKSFVLLKQMGTELIRDYFAPIRSKKEMYIGFSCHSAKNKFENPLTQASYDVYEMKLHKNSKGDGFYNVFSEWVSMILFANYEVFVIKDAQEKKKYGVGDGKRILFTTPKPAYDAKNRFNLPDQIEMDWSSIVSGIKSFYESCKLDTKNPEIDSIKIEIFNMIKKIENEELRESTIMNVKSVGNDLDRLKKAKQYIKGVI